MVLSFFFLKKLNLKKKKEKKKLNRKGANLIVHSLVLFIVSYSDRFPTSSLPRYFLVTVSSGNLRELKTI